MRHAVVLLLAASAVVAGCAAPSQGLDDTRVDGAGSAPWYVEHATTVRPDHRAAYDVPVARGASSLNATLHLDADDAGLGVPGAPVARLTIRIASPENATLAVAQADASAPVATALAAVSTPGTYRVEVVGAGFSHDLDGGTLGASYRISIEVA